MGQVFTTQLNAGSGAASGITIGTSVITGGTDTRVLFDDGGFIGENAGLTFSKATGLLSATLVSVGGAAIGTNALAVTGTANFGSVGSAATPTLSVGNATTGLYSVSTTGLGLTVNGVVKGDYGITNSGQWTFTSAGIILNSSSSVVLSASSGGNNWTVQAGSNNLTTTSGNVVLTSTGAYSFNSDTNINRLSSGIMQVGTSAGNALGSLNLTNLTGTGTIIIGTADATTSAGGALQVTGGASVAKRFWLPAITASSGLQTAVLCQSSGGEVIADSVACLASSARFKDMMGKAESGALDKIIKVPIQKWKYRRESDSVFPENYYSEHIGPTAEDIEAIDSRLVGRDKEGKARSISTEQLLALAIQAIQEQQVQIDELKVLSA